MKDNLEQEEPQSKRRKLSTKRNLRTDAPTNPLAQGPTSVEESKSSERPRGLTSEADRDKFCHELMSCHLRAIGNCDWRTLGPFPEFQAETSDDDNSMKTAVTSSELLPRRGQDEFFSLTGPGSSKTVNKGQSFDAPLDRDSKCSNQAPSKVGARNPTEQFGAGPSRTIATKNTEPGKRPLRVEPLGSSATSGHSSNKMDIATSSTACSPPPLTMPSCCPICQFEFPTSMNQLETDSHIATCLAAATDDITW